MAQLDCLMAAVLPGQLVQAPGKRLAQAEIVRVERQDLVRLHRRCRATCAITISTAIIRSSSGELLDDPSNCR
jgi:hypothetical protein